MYCNENKKSQVKMSRALDRPPRIGRAPLLITEPASSQVRTQISLQFSRVQTIGTREIYDLVAFTRESSESCCPVFVMRKE